MDNIVKLNISNLDKEIEELDSQIVSLQTKRAIKVELKDYILKHALPAHTNGVPVSSINPANNDVAIANGEYGALSDFILNQLDESIGKESYVITSAYAKKLGVDAEQVRNNVSNALNRLKAGKNPKVRSVPQGLGKKAGYLWYKIKGEHA